MIAQGAHYGAFRSDPNKGKRFFTLPDNRKEPFLVGSPSPRRPETPSGEVKNRTTSASDMRRNGSTPGRDGAETRTGSTAPRSVLRRGSTDGRNGTQTRNGSRSRPSVREQAAAKRASKGSTGTRAHALLARANKEFQKVRRSAKQRLKGRKADAKTAARVKRAAVLANRMDRLARIVARNSS